MPRLQGYRERMWWKYYDTLDLSQFAPRAIFFTNRNVGNVERCNLQIGEQFAGDQTFVCLSFYALCPIDERIAKIQMEFEVGNKSILPIMSLKDWLMGFRPLRPPIVPVRQNFRAIANWDPDLDLGTEPFEVATHFEGLLTRDVA